MRGSPPHPDPRPALRHSLKALIHVRDNGSQTRLFAPR